VTREELLALPVVLDVPTAGRAYGIGERHAYELARQGEFPVPVLRLGRLLRVRRADLLADLAPGVSEAGPATGPALALADSATARKQVSRAG
jgi:predicted DNA-binding transcriptional regulator AlpA